MNAFSGSQLHGHAHERQEEVAIGLQRIGVSSQSGVQTQQGFGGEAAGKLLIAVFGIKVIIIL